MQNNASLATAPLEGAALEQEIERRVKERTAHLYQEHYQLLHAQKLEALEQLTGRLAFDFNNMLAIVIGNLDTLSDALDADVQNWKLADGALEAACRGADITRQLLAFSRKQQLGAEASDLADLTRSTLRLFERTLPENIALEFKPPANLHPVMIDPNLLRTAILNIATNARDALAKGGKITVEARNYMPDAAYLAANPEVTPGEYVQLSISDNGVGMTPEVLERAFEPFFTTKIEGEGTGLGLSLVFGFMRQSGGYVTIESVEGKGTTVRMLIPRSNSAADKETISTEHRETQWRSNDETILVVEDIPGVRKTVSQQLRDLGYRVLEADNAESARAILARKDPIDLLFTDIVMPGGTNGRELAKEAVKARPGLKVLLTSGYPGGPTEAKPGDVRTALLAKPYRLRELAEKIRDTLDQS